MKSDPVFVALRNVAETKQLLESLIFSSESFDYQKAKIALGKLERKIKQLGKLQSKWEVRIAPRQSNIHHVNFRSAASSRSSIR